MTRCFKFILLFLFVLPLGVIAQNKNDSTATRTISFRAFYENGTVFKTNDFLKYNQVTGMDIDRFQGASLQALWQTNGSYAWEEIFNYPKLGFGVWTAHFFDAPNLGTPFAFYGVFNAPFVRGKRLSFNYELEMGLAMNWNTFDPYTNKSNIAIGDDETVYLDLGSYLEYEINDRFSAEIGFSLAHFSNGALKLPNKGINTIQPKFVLQYRPFAVKIDQTKHFDLPELNKYEFQLSAYGASKNVLYTGNDIDSISKYQGVYFSETGLIASLHRIVGHKSKFGFGINLGYNGSAKAVILVEGKELDEENATLNEGFEMSIFPSYELVIDKVAVILQPSFYIHRTKYEGITPNTYQRLGIKYHFNDNLFAGLSLRAYKYHVSDYIEWNVGYRIQWK